MNVKQGYFDTGAVLASIRGSEPRVIIIIMDDIHAERTRQRGATRATNWILGSSPEKH